MQVSRWFHLWKRQSCVCVMVHLLFPVLDPSVITDLFPEFHSSISVYHLRLILLRYLVTLSSSQTGRIGKEKNVVAGCLQGLSGYLFHFGTCFEEGWLALSPPLLCGQEHGPII